MHNKSNKSTKEHKGRFFNLPLANGVGIFALGMALIAKASASYGMYYFALGVFFAVCGIMVLIIDWISNKYEKVIEEKDKEMIKIKEEYERLSKYKREMGKKIKDSDKKTAAGTTPLTIGVEGPGGMMVPLIMRNMTYPTKKIKHVIFTSVDNQSEVEVKVFEGERAMTKDCHLLGSLVLSGIPPAPSGMTKIEVTLELSANGLMNVRAEEKITGSSKQITITNEKVRILNDIDRMVSDAAKYETQDKERRESIEAKTNLENYVFSMIADSSNAVKIDEVERRKIKEECELVIQWLRDNQEAAKSVYLKKKEEIEDTCNSFMKKLYQDSADGTRSAVEKLN